ncbi:MAG: DUF4127 family protein [Candidatus Eremiobacteraeota bacterium]|nr:DUF4127 family protein [Candidatus Eremiobacteraeota bacterium]
MKSAMLFVFLLGVIVPGATRASTGIAFVPLDDRPVTRQLPQLLGKIAGVIVSMPPRVELGRYLHFGEPQAITDWLNSPQTDGVGAYIVSTDMLAYGGLVASRVPGVSAGLAISRLRELEVLRAHHPHAWIAAFGTIMRLAPTGVPAIGPGKDFFAAYPAWSYVQQYANLHDPPLPSENATAAHLRELLGPTLEAYLAARARNRDADAWVLRMTADDTINRVVLGQDDAGPVGLHLRDVAALKRISSTYRLGDRVSIEPGADELGMALVAHALARSIGWIPRIGVRYSTASGAQYNDPLEFAPISTAIASLIRLCGAVQVEDTPDITLYVRVPQTQPLQDQGLLGRMSADVAENRSVAFADLSFLSGGFAPQAAFAESLMRAGIAGKIDAYASWNTNANTVGTALAESIAAGVGRRSGHYNPVAHAEFTLNRYIDDYAFHDYVRPNLNDELNLRGVKDHTLLLPGEAFRTDHQNRAALWRRALAVLAAVYPQYEDSGLTITLPWDRTFETQIDLRLSPGISR